MQSLEMTRNLSMPLSGISIPKGYSIISVNEDNGCLWEEVMDSSFGDHQPGSFRYVMVANNGYEEDRVFVLLDEDCRPVATASAWDYGIDNWYCDSMPEVSFVAVMKRCQGRGFGALMTNYALHELCKRGYATAHLGIWGTDTGDNYPAVKTYINCGFTPYIIEEGQIEAWKRVYIHLSLPVPELHYTGLINPIADMPHPPRPWPYQIRCAAQAHKNGDKYIFGLWNEHNIFNPQYRKGAKHPKRII